MSLLLHSKINTCLALCYSKIQYRQIFYSIVGSAINSFPFFCSVVVKPIYNKDSDANALDAEAGCAKANEFFISFTEDVVPSFTHVPQYNIAYPHPQQ